MIFYPLFMTQNLHPSWDWPRFWNLAKRIPKGYFQKKKVSFIRSSPSSPPPKKKKKHPQGLHSAAPASLVRRFKRSSWMEGWRGGKRRSLRFSPSGKLPDGWVWQGVFDFPEALWRCSSSQKAPLLLRFGPPTTRGVPSEWVLLSVPRSACS